ncbi:hypothetical protein [Sphingorhabdus sp. M41]|uniref:hypothetical protein n=1 Tax=Sphingorhabdus sp. M41 TaxID=1806885 RepID=UPI0012E7CDC8|nr:hypothetical protein [Sphingorhabdus sp. M41]
MAGMISASALYLFLNHKMKSHEGGSDMSLAIRKSLTTDSMDDSRAEKTRFSVPKLNLSAKSLTKFLKKPKKSPGQVTELKDLPNIRPADRHPDAPARQPIFASSDLGAPLADTIKRFDSQAASQDIAEPAKQSAEPNVTPDPFAAERSQSSASEQEPVAARTENIVQPEAAASPKADLSTLSLAQLADRLEAGLRRLEALEMRERTAAPQASLLSTENAEKTVSLAEVSERSAPVSIPSLRSVDPAEVDAQDNRQADMDAALKAALGTLERMTAQR